MNWKSLTDITLTNEIVENSHQKTAVIFKHSTRCGISRMVLKEFENQQNKNENLIDFYYLDLLNHQDISTKLAEQFSVEHQSPQILVLKNGQLKNHDSHYGILDIALEPYL
jgi:bacillithiol system protein YtxJ